MVNPALFQHFRKRRHERGAAVFVVVLVLMMLTGLGVYASKSATLSISSSGFERQMTQTHYITDYALLTTTSELSTSRRDAYIRLMATSPDTNCVATQNTSNPTCYRFGYSDLEKQVSLQTNNAKILVATDIQNKVPGSLGPGQLDADFLVEMSDLSAANPPMVGSDLSSIAAVNVFYMSVTLSATGQIRPTADTTLLDQDSATSASIESARARIVVGPLSKL